MGVLGQSGPEDVDGCVGVGVLRDAVVVATRVGAGVVLLVPGCGVAVSAGVTGLRGVLGVDVDHDTNQSLVGQNDCIEIFSYFNIIRPWTQSTDYISSSTIATSTWYFIVVIGDGSTFKLYINNSQVASKSRSTTNYGSNSNYTTTFGSRVKNASANPFNGILDEIAIWSSALSTAQISNIYNSGVGVDDLTVDYSSNLIGYWKFEQNLNDGSSNSNNGTFSGSSGTNSSATYEDVTSSLSLR